MSWSDRARGAGRAWRLVAGFLGGCFQPLYSEAAHPGLVADMQAVEVAPIKDRIGHYLGDDLITNLNGTGSTPAAKYRLTVTMTSEDPDADRRIPDQRRRRCDGRRHGASSR